MAEILLSAVTVSQIHVGSWKDLKIVTDATADGADFIDLSSLYDVGCTSVVSNAADGTLLANDEFTDKQVTLPGATANEVRTIIVHGH